MYTTIDNLRRWTYTSRRVLHHQQKFTLIKNIQNKQGDDETVLHHQQKFTITKNLVLWLGRRAWVYTNSKSLQRYI